MCTPSFILHPLHDLQSLTSTEPEYSIPNNTMDKAGLEARHQRDPNIPSLDWNNLQGCAIQMKRNHDPNSQEVTCQLLT